MSPKKHNVIIYTTPACPYCAMTKAFLRKNGVEFVEVNVAEDKAAALEMIQKSGQMGVPVLDIDGEIIVGYNLNAIKKALEIP